VPRQFATRLRSSSSVHSEKSLRTYRIGMSQAVALRGMSQTAWSDIGQRRFLLSSRDVDAMSG
jgi:hypothetical protein